MKPLHEQTEPELKETFRVVAERVKWSLPTGTLFCVLAMEEKTGPGITQYVSNCDRGTMAQFLRETADRFERNDLVARIEEPAHPNATDGERRAIRMLERLSRAAADAAVAMTEISKLHRDNPEARLGGQANRKLTVCLNRVGMGIRDFAELHRQITGDGDEATGGIDQDGGPL